MNTQDGCYVSVTQCLLLWQRLLEIFRKFVHEEILWKWRKHFGIISSVVKKCIKQTWVILQGYPPFLKPDIGSQWNMPSWEYLYGRINIVLVPWANGKYHSTSKWSRYREWLPGCQGTDILDVVMVYICGNSCPNHLLLYYYRLLNRAFPK